jgi:hypothetical protein
MIITIIIIKEEEEGKKNEISLSYFSIYINFAAQIKEGLFTILNMNQVE